MYLWCRCWNSKKHIEVFPHSSGAWWKRLIRPHYCDNWFNIHRTIRQNVNRYIDSLQVNQRHDVTFVGRGSLIATFSERSVYFSFHATYYTKKSLPFRCFDNDVWWRDALCWKQCCDSSKLDNFSLNLVNRTTKK